MPDNNAKGKGNTQIQLGQPESISQQNSVWVSKGLQ